MARMNKTTISTFYCPHCGQRAMEIPRPRSLQRKAFHRKKLYCPNCRNIYNCVECRNDYECYQFRLNYENGYYEGEEAYVE